MDKDENFLERWSRRKRSPDDEPALKKEAAPQDQHAAVPPDQESEQANQAQSPAEAPQDETAAPQEPAPWEGVDIETLNADSDYTVFMAKGVPDNVRKEALDKLWRSDPVFANLDGLNDYDDDYSKWGMVNQVVKTAYKVGQGYLTDEQVAENLAARESDDAIVAAAESEEQGGDIAASEEPSEAIAQGESELTPQTQGVDQPSNNQAEAETLGTKIVDDEPDEVA
jgi:Protein of unknown function (DUF3306)